MMQKIERFLPPALISLTFLITYLALYFSAVPLFDDTDVPWHLATGALILNEGALPATDPWSFASAGQTWYVISWMWDVIIAIVNGVTGEHGVFIFLLAFISIIAALLARNLTERKVVGTDALVLTLFMAALCFIDFAQARPQVIGYLCVVWTHGVLHKSRADESLRRLWTLPLIMVLWVNNHGSFLAGFTLIGAYGLEALFAKRWIWFKHLFIIGALCAVALLVNPYGFHMLTAVMRSLDSAVTQYLIEWMPFVFSNNLGVSVWFLVFVCVGCLREPAVPLADKIISLLWLVAMLFSMRNAAVFFLVSAPAIAISLQKLSEQLASIRTVRPDLMPLLLLPGQRLRMVAAAVVVLLVSAGMMGVLRGDSLISPDHNPTAAIAWLKEHAVGKRILNEYRYGGQLIYETRGAVPLFVDGRAGTAYSEETLKEYLAFLTMEKDWGVIVDKYNINGILVGNRNLFAIAYADGQYRDQWKEVYRDDVASIYMRKKK